MGSFDCYCALCCGPLGIFSIKVGSQKPRALARRRKRVENKTRRLKGEDLGHGDSEVEEDEGKEEDDKAKEEKGEGIKDAEMKDADADDESETNNEPNDEDDGPWDSQEEDINPIEMDADGSDDDQEEGDASNSDENEEDDDTDLSDHFSQTSELSLAPSFNMTHSCTSESNSMYSYYEKKAYDPTKITRKDVQWLDRARLLAIDPESEPESDPESDPEWKADNAAYLTGRGRYNDLFDFHITGKGRGFTGTRAVYHVYEAGEDTVSYPMHEACYTLLTQRLATKKKPKIDKDVLYAMMDQNKEDLANALNLDYGDINGPEQFWECHAGEEWTVADPATRHGIEALIQDILPAKLLDRPSKPSLDLAHKVRQDPLAVLPYDVLHGIFAELSRKDTISLMQASWHVFDSTRDPVFWRLMIRVHIRPFFWELDTFFANATLPDTFDYRGMFQWLNEITKGEFGMSGPLMHIANRRRIWEVCQQVAPMYFEKLHERVYTEPSAEEAAAVMAAAQNLFMPKMLFPYPAEPTPLKTQFIRSWSEIKYRGCNFDTYWAEPYDRLVGISVDFGSGPRLFGSTNGRKGQSLRIRSNDWIKEIRFSTTRLEPLQGANNKKRAELTGRDDEKSINESKIDGLKVILKSGEEKNVSRFQYDRNQRTLQVLEGMHLIGLEGTTSPVYFKPPIPKSILPQPLPPIPLRQRLLWSSHSTNFYIPKLRTTVPIYHHPTRSHLAFSSPAPPPSQPFLHPDALPWTTLIWAENLKAYSTLRGLSALQVRDEYSSASIIGIKVRTTHKYGGGKEVGTYGPVPAQMMEKWATVPDFPTLDLWNNKQSWEEECMRHFEIDGPGGERVVEVRVTMDRRSVKLVTSQGREGVFGEEGVEGKEWDVLKAKEGEVIVGLSVCFGRLGGWSERTKMWSHLGASDFGIVVANGEKEDE